MSDDLNQWLGAKPPRTSALAWTHYEAQRPLFAHDASALMALALGARLLERLSKAGASDIPPAAVRAAARAANASLPDALAGPLEGEVDAMLRWLMDGPELGQAPGGRLAESDMARMRASMPQRVALFELAIERSQDVEFEFLDTSDPDDPSRGRWVVWVGRPVEVLRQSGHTSLVVRVQGTRHEVLARHVRWLMPVGRKPEPKAPPRAPSARVLSFPGAASESE